jgi:Cft2 family RNA processing exonuclease
VLLEYKKQKHFFTGDVLFRDQLTIKGASFPRVPLDTLVMETTRGATPHHEGLTREGETIRLLQSVRDAIDAGGSILIAAFAFGRMQEVLMMLHAAQKEGTLPACPVFCSGLGVDLADYFDLIGRKTGTVKFRRYVMKDLGARPLRGKFVQPGIDIQERGIYVLSSGMLVQNTPAWRISANLIDFAHNTIAFVGYCDPETPGGRLLNAKPGDAFEYPPLEYTGHVNAKIERFHMSGHADRDELLQYAKDTEPKHLVLTHGDPPAREWFAARAKEVLPATKVIDPVPGATFEV